MEVLDGMVRAGVCVAGRYVRSGVGCTMTRGGEEGKMMCVWVGPAFGWCGCVGLGMGKWV